MPTKRGGYNYSTASRAMNLGSKKGHGNPSEEHSSRNMSTVRKPKSSAAGLQGLSVGQQVPMDIFQQKYQKPDVHSMTQHVESNVVKRGTKKALRGAQSKFFGL
jgi:hypothetical protein